MRRILAGLGVCLLLSLPAGAQTWEIVHNFRSDGQPLAAPIQASDGHLYGTSSLGGANGFGTVYRVTLAGTLTTLWDFSKADGAYPHAAVIEASDNLLYGTTHDGGAFGHGTVFTLTLDGTVRTTLHSFSLGDGSRPEAGLLEGSDGKFYGTTSEGGAFGRGTIFRIDSAGGLTTLHSFEGPQGAVPFAALIEAGDGNFYGTASAGGGSDKGTVFRMSPAGTVTTLHSFSETDGAEPRAALLEASDAHFYGTTFRGGATGGGTVFRMAADGTLTPLHAFMDSDGLWPTAPLIEASDGHFYGTTQGAAPSSTYGTVFSMDDTGEVTPLHAFAYTDGGTPTAAVLEASDGNFYSTTRDGGPGAVGLVFRMDDQDTVTTVTSFPASEGWFPDATILLADDGRYYGTTAVGGANGTGTVYRMDADLSIETVASFGAEDGVSHPVLIQAEDDDFYGVNAYAGMDTYGTIYRMTAGGTVTTLHTFEGTDGTYPRALVQAADDDFYGATSHGGSADLGTIFRVDSTGGFETLHEFTDFEGGSRPSSLVAMPAGDFYGTVLEGGFGSGAIFHMDAEGTVTIAHNFSTPEGFGPGSLALGSDGLLYGTAANGGLPGGGGTVFRFDPAGSELRVLHAFANLTGEPWAPVAAPLLASDGNLYGTAAAGLFSVQGSVWRIDPDGLFKNLHVFHAADGSSPTGIMEAADGSLLGIAQFGPSNGGLIYRVWPSDGPISVTGLTPSSGPSSGGTAVTIHGSGFLTGLAVAIGDLPAQVVAVPDASTIDVLAPSLTIGILHDVVVSRPDFTTALLPDAYFVDFLDVPQDDIFHAAVEELVRRKITAGCGSGLYCRNQPVRRDQMAVLLLRAKHGPGYFPPDCVGLFTDVVCPGIFTNWVEQLAAEGITGGCGGSNYCPNDPVTRSQMAVFLLKGEHGSGYAPPACGGLFDDVVCPGQFTDWIEQLAAEQITGGCSAIPPLYCPASSVTRGQMAVFLTKTLPAP